MNTFKIVAALTVLVVIFEGPLLCVALMPVNNTFESSFSFFKKIEIKSAPRAVAFSHNGKHLLVGSHDGKACLWDIETEKELQVFALRNSPIWAVACSPDGKTIFTGGTAALLWDMVTGDQLYVFRSPCSIDGAVTSVAYSPDGKTILTGSEDKKARLWNIKGTLMQEFRGHTESVFSVAYSPDGKMVLTGSRDNTARLWDVETGKQLQIFEGHTKCVYCVAYSPDGKTVFTGSFDGTARLWDPLTGEQLLLFTEQTKGIYLSAAYSPDGKTVLTGLLDKTGSGVVVLWDIKTGKPMQRFTDYPGAVYSVAFSPDGNMIAAGSCDDKSVTLLSKGTLYIP